MMNNYKPDYKPDYKIDPRGFEDIKSQIRELAASYVPEWVFDTEKPDIGSVIALLFARQFSETVDRLNQLPEKYRTEFVNMLNIGLNPAFPAQGAAVMELFRDTVTGVNVPAGTKLIGTKQDGETTVFETKSDLCVTNSKLAEVMAISPESGKIVPVYNKDGKDAPDTLPPFRLFDFSAEGIQENTLKIYHQSVFDTGRDVTVSVRIRSVGGIDMSEHFCNTDKYVWSYYDGEQLVPFSEVIPGNEQILLKRDGEIGKVNLKTGGISERLSTVCLKALGTVSHPVEIQTLELSSFCEGVPPSFVIHNESEMDTECFMPFGEQASVFDECYIAHDGIFSQQGAKVVLRFNMSFREKLVTFTPEQEEVQLKIVKRIPKQIVFDTARTCAQQVVTEYFNGAGWKRLVCDSDPSALFDGHVFGDAELSFECPDDWKPIAIGTGTQRVIRIRISHADNCYLQPCLHNMPVIKNLTVSYSYGEKGRLPHRLRAVTGTQERDLMPALLAGKVFTAFSPLPYSGNALYLGFDRPMGDAPASLFFSVSEGADFSGVKIRFEYSSSKGFSDLRIRDGTGGLSKSGTVMFVPHSDFAAVEVEGRTRYWLRMSLSGASAGYHPKINKILTNAVPIHNVRTQQEEPFYIDAPYAGMSFPLSAGNILSAQVYVNEKNLSRDAMNSLMKERPGDIRARYDALGRPSEFFVKWEERENFYGSKPGDRHYVLDRMEGKIRFGDGINVRIPMCTDAEAFTVQIRCCDGAAANLPEGAVDSLMGNVLYIDSVYNPEATYAGSDIESAQQAVERGAGIVNSRNRLVSEADFVRETKAFSGMISQVKCVPGQLPSGVRKDGAFSLVVLMRDYADGSYSFEGIRDRLKEDLLKKSEATLTEDCLAVTEPVFVTVSADIWIKVNDRSEGFGVRDMITGLIESVIEPVTDVCKIGQLPAERELKASLNRIKGSVSVNYFNVTVRYTDLNGTHECELSALKVTPFMLGVSGRHSVKIL
ncbi:MAG: baseplate J/gp47 family protein [Oscillospiraceae bacterium]|jgi:hypothetical protein|nr:baseplate J/gp47 family protein [Oscillospiraceae bacterium]